MHQIREGSRGSNRHFIGCISQVVLLTQDYLSQYEHIAHDRFQSVWFHLAVALLCTVALRGSIGELGASVMLMLQGLEVSRAIPGSLYYMSRVTFYDYLNPSKPT